MEKYGVCNTCHGRPTDADDLKTFTKTASGGYSCPQCGQEVLSKLFLNDSVKVKDTENEVQPDIGSDGEV